MPTAMRKKAAHPMATKQVVALAATTDPAVRGRTAALQTAATQPGPAPAPVVAWSQMRGPVGP